MGLEDIDGLAANKISQNREAVSTRNNTQSVTMAKC